MFSQKVILSLAVLLVSLSFLACDKSGVELKPISINSKAQAAATASVTKEVETMTEVAVATSTPTAVPTPTKSAHVSIIDASDAAMTPCVGLYQKDSHKVVFVNQNVCIFSGIGALQGATFVYLLNPQSIKERNEWLDEVGNWIKLEGFDGCNLKTVYLTLVSFGPLFDQVHNTPGEKAFYSLGGNAKPTFCPTT